MTHAEEQRRYRESAKGRATEARYATSPARRAAQARYRATTKGMLTDLRTQTTAAYRRREELHDS